MQISGGTVYVDGPTDGGNGALDYDGSGEVSGGTVVAVGSVGMAMGFTSGSTQGSILCNFPSSVAAGTAFALKLCIRDRVNVVWVTLSGLRKKLAALESGVQIQAARGIGYRLEERG